MRIWPRLQPVARELTHRLSRFLHIFKADSHRAYSWWGEHFDIYLITTHAMRKPCWITDWNLDYQDWLSYKPKKFNEASLNCVCRFRLGECVRDCVLVNSYYCYRRRRFCGLCQCSLVTGIDTIVGTGYRVFLCVSGALFYYSKPHNPDSKFHCINCFRTG